MTAKPNPNPARTAPGKRWHDANDRSRTLGTRSDHAVLAAAARQSGFHPHEIEDLEETYSIAFALDRGQTPPKQ